MLCTANLPARPYRHDRVTNARYGFPVFSTQIMGNHVRRKVSGRMTRPRRLSAASLLRAT